MPRFLFSYRVPQNYQPSAETRKAWEAWFESLDSNLADVGRGVLATRTTGCLDAGTRLGGYSVVTAEAMEAAGELAEGCPALRLGGGVEIGAIPEIHTRQQG